MFLGSCCQRPSGGKNPALIDEKRSVQPTCNSICRWSLPWVIAFALQCSNPTDQPADTGEVIIVSVVSSLAVLHRGSDQLITTHVSDIPRSRDAFAQTASRDQIYFTAFGPGMPQRLFSFDTRSLEVSSRLLTDISDASQIGAIQIFGSMAISPTPDGEKLLVATAEKDGVEGILVLDKASLNPIQFLGPFSVQPGGMEVVGPGSLLPSGGILLLGNRSSVRSAPSQLFILDGASLAVVDSAVFEESRLRQVLSAADGKSVYVLGDQAIYRYDLGTRTIVASVQAPSPGWLALAGDGRTLYMTDPGDGRNHPGSGMLFVFTDILEALSPFDLRSAGIDGVPPVLNRAAVSRGDSLIYVASGTAERGPLFGPQPARVLVVSAMSGNLVEIIDVGDWGGWHIFRN